MLFWLYSSDPANLCDPTNGVSLLANVADAIRESALGAGIKQCSEAQLSSPCMAGILDHAETMDGRGSDDSGHAGKSKNSVA